MNLLKGKIMDVRSSRMISLITVDVDGDAFSSIILEGEKTGVNYQKGDPVNIVFKETEVGIAKNLSGQISFRNRFTGTIKSVEKGDVLAKVTVDYRGHSIEAIISAKSAEEMGLKPNDKIEWLVKTNEISLMGVVK